MQKSSYMNRIPPFVKITLITICGIIASNCIVIPIMTGMLSVTVLLIVSVLLKSKSNAIASISATIALFLFGLTLPTVHRIELSHFANYELSDVTYRAIVETAPLKRKKSKTCEIKITNIFNDSVSIPTTGRTFVYMPIQVTELNIGDTIYFKSQPQPTVSPEIVGQFDFREYLAIRRIYHQVFLYNGIVIKPAKDLSLGKMFANANQYITNALNVNDRYVVEFQVSKALLTGDKHDIDRDLRNSYSRLGIAHLLAVSGLHVGVIFLVFTFILSFLNYNNTTRIIKALLILLIIWFYVGLAGFAPSVQRAGLMFSVLTIGNLSRSKYSSLNALAFACFITLLINPLTISDVGFQMSYIAVLSIVIVGNYLQNRIPFSNKLLIYVSKMAIITVSAQIALFPLVAYYFHQVSILFLITNVIIVPLFTFVIIPLLILGVAIAWIPLVSQFTIEIAYSVLKLVNILTMELSTLKYAAFDGIYISLTELLVIYIIMIITAVFAYKVMKYDR